MYPKLTRPDRKFNAAGEFSIGVRMSEADAADLIEALSADLEEAYKRFCADEGKKKLKRSEHLPWKIVEDDAGEATGDIMFKGKMTHRVEPKNGDPFEQTPSVFDAAGNPMSDTVGGGSIVRMNAEVYAWYTAALGVGISLRLRAVQVIELVAPGGNAESYGFEAEDGFVTAPTSEPAATTADGGGDDSEEF